MEKKPVCVSLGAGVPEGISVQALHALEEADLIYVPSTEGGASRAKECLDALGIPSAKMVMVQIPMMVNRSAAQQAYTAISTEIARQYAAGKHIAISTIGDAGIYSTVHRVAEDLAHQNITLEYIAGIPSFIEAAARFGINLVSGDRALVVLSHIEELDSLTREIAQGSTVVLMKLSRYRNLLPELLMREASRADFFYVENLGDEAAELLLTEAKAILAREVPYFSLLIIKPKER